MRKTDAMRSVRQVYVQVTLRGQDTVPPGHGAAPVKCRVSEHIVLEQVPRHWSVTSSWNDQLQRPLSLKQSALLSNPY